MVGEESGEVYRNPVISTCGPLNTYLSHGDLTTVGPPFERPLSETGTSHSKTQQLETDTTHTLELSPHFIIFMVTLECRFDIENNRYFDGDIEGRLFMTLERESYKRI